MSLSVLEPSAAAIDRRLNQQAATSRYFLQRCQFFCYTAASRISNSLNWLVAEINDLDATCRIVTSAEEGGYVFGSVCLSVCLFVCLSVGLLANL